MPRSIPMTRTVRFALSLAVAALTPATLLAQGGTSFIRGDVNRDSTVTLADAARLALFFADPGGLPCEDAADVDDNGLVIESDPGFPSDLELLLDWLFAATLTAGPALPPPFPALGVDPTPDALDCVSRLRGPPDPVSEREHRLEWRQSGSTRPGARFEMFLRVTAAQPILGISLAYVIDTRYVQLRGVDLASTDFPAGARRDFENSPLFRSETVPLADGRTLLLFGEVFVDLDAGGVIPFRATESAPFQTSLLRLTLSVRTDAAMGPDPVAILTPFLGSFGPPHSILVGVHNGAIDLGGGGLSFAAASSDEGVVIINDGMEFLRGDANSDRVLDLSDALFTLSYLFSGGPAPLALDAADSNDDGAIDIADPTFGLGYLFTGGPPPPGPFPECGFDLTDDFLVTFCESQLAICPECPICCGR